MSVFKFKALDSENKTVTGLVEAPTEDAAVEVLHEKSLEVLYTREESTNAFGQLPIFNKIKIKDVVIFSRQFAVLISANVAMVQSLKIVTEQTESPKLKMTISKIADEVDAGTRLSEAMAKYPDVFSDFYVSVIKSGETSGKLEEILVYLADEMEKDYDIISKVKGAMIYPAFVMGGLLIVGTVMMIFVVPKLTSMLTDSGTELPFATRALIATSSFMVNFWWLAIIIIVVVSVIVKRFIKTQGGRRMFDLFKLRMPIFGTLFQRIYLVRFTRSMNTLILGGVTITKSLKIASEVVSNQIYKELIEETIRQVEDGNSISAIFSNSKEIPRMVSQMMSIGEKTGKLDIVLSKVSDFYTREINNIVANLMTLMEPIIMVIIGVAVGLMVAAIILPMYNMANSF